MRCLQPFSKGQWRCSDADRSAYQIVEISAFRWSIQRGHHRPEQTLVQHRPGRLVSFDISPTFDKNEAALVPQVAQHLDTLATGKRADGGGKRAKGTFQRRVRSLS